jgi:hypothetical protein
VAWFHVVPAKGWIRYNVLAESIVEPALPTMLLCLLYQEVGKSLMKADL